MDETAIQHAYEGGKGNCATPRIAPFKREGLAYQRIPRMMTRGHTTLVAFIANDAVLQRSLPQIFLPGSRRAPPSAAAQAKYADLPPPLEAMLGTGGWVNAHNLPHILTRLRRAVRTHRPGALLLLLMDSATQHLSTDVLRHAARLNIYILFVPGSLTWLLQPLDVKVFGALKARLKELHLLQPRGD